MRLRHIDLQVSDVDAAREFFEKFFGLRCTYQREKQIAFFTDKTGFEFAVSNLFKSPPPIYPPDFHAGFILDHTSQVREIYERLQKAGVKMKLNLGVKGPNLVFQCVGPDSIPVEVRAPKDS
jgi:catechol 2,3-dioxygenase-like lactoylglutathione lyase family enzyme